MGALVMFRPNKRSSRRQVRQEMTRMYQLSGGGRDPLPSDASREAFALGLIEEVAWQDWETYCRTLIDKISPGE